MNVPQGRLPRHGVYQTGQLDIVDEAASASDQTEVFFAPHRLTDTFATFPEESIRLFLDAQKA
jgi:hypothetical protein